MILCAVIGLVEYGIYLLTGQTLAYSSIGASAILIGLCAGALFVSYKKHRKNLMKCLMGALLMSLIFDGVASLSFMYIKSDYICTPIFIALGLALFINHCIINESRHPSPVQVKLNQILAVLFAVNIIIWVVNSLIILPVRIFDIVSMALYILGCVGLAASIVCIESRLDAYRIDREAAGWTEENGYPENYVHEYEKK